MEHRVAGCTFFARRPNPWPIRLVYEDERNSRSPRSSFMHNLLRTFSLALMTMIGLGAAAQGHMLYVSGHVSPCNPSLNGSEVLINVYGQNATYTHATATLNANCYYYAEFLVPDTSGWVAVSGSCGNGVVSADSTAYSVTSPGATEVLLNLNCSPAPTTYQVTVSGQVSPCDLLDNTVTVRCTTCMPWVEVVVPVDTNCTYQATLSVPSTTGTIVVATGCSNGLVPNNTMQYIVNPSIGYTSLTLNLSCAPPPATACFNVTGTAPFTASFTNCSTGCLPPFTFLWDFSGPNGGTVSGDAVSHTFPGPGTYAVCLSFTGADGCQGNSCQQVYVNANGGINTGTGWFDCLGVVNGADTTGAPCQQGGIVGIWNSNCECTIVSSCQACYTMVQSAPFSAVFNGSCSSGSPGTLTYLWDISGPNGGSFSGGVLDHTFPGPGSYAVCLNVSSSSGCVDVSCRQVYVGPNGNISFTQPSDCHACITITQSQSGGALVPFSVDLTSCAQGIAPLSVEWALPNGAWASGNTHTFAGNGAGHYFFCATVSAGNGCTNTTCDSIYIDANGWIVTTPIIYDCLQIPNGPNMPGTPCSNPATGITGTWDATCTCVPQSTGSCEADFWVLQAYENGDTTGNGVPIPNTLWVWNLSNGGTGLFQFQWNFGDGSVSELPFPSHTYAGSGPYILCLTITDSEGCTDTHCDSLFVDDDGLYNGMIGGGGSRSGFTVNVVNPLAMNVADRALDAMAVWPNPVREQLNIALESTLNGAVSVEVVDLNGRTVMSQQERITTGRNRILLSTEALPAGLYAVRLSNGTHMITQRFVRN